MARRSRAGTAASRAAIVRAAARLFRLKGYRGAGLQDIMRAAGLTVGTFYAHFPSKAALFGEALRFGTAKTIGVPEDRLPAEKWLRRFLATYITESHRDRPGSGCLIACLVSELARGEAGSKKAIEAALSSFVKRSTRPGASQRAGDRAVTMFCLAVGSLALSRAVPRGALSRRILRASREHALKASG